VLNSLVRLLRWEMGLETIVPWAESDETAAISRHARGKRRLAEIGVWEGGTTRILREVMSADAVLYAIDPFPRGRLGISYQRAIAHGEVRQIHNGEVVWIRGTGESASRDPRISAAPFDFIFIDADHSFEGLRTDWRAWAPMAADVVAIHDVVGDPDEGSVRFAREHVFTDPRFRVVEVVGCLAVLQRRKPL
jgi:hypothetical protein